MGGISGDGGLLKGSGAGAAAVVAGLALALSALKRLILIKM